MLLYSKVNNQQNYKATMEWEKISANDISDKGLITKMYEELFLKNSTPKNQIILLKNGQKT